MQGTRGDFLEEFLFQNSSCSSFQIGSCPGLSGTCGSGFWSACACSQRGNLSPARTCLPETFHDGSRIFEAGLPNFLATINRLSSELVQIQASLVSRPGNHENEYTLCIQHISNYTCIYRHIPQIEKASEKPGNAVLQKHLVIAAINRAPSPTAHRPSTRENMGWTPAFELPPIGWAALKRA